MHSRIEQVYGSCRRLECREKRGRLRALRSVGARCMVAANVARAPIAARGRPSRPKVVVDLVPSAWISSRSSFSIDQDDVEIA